MSEFLPIRYPNRGDTQLDTENMRRALESLNMLLRMEFDKRYFFVSRTASHMSISMREAIDNTINKINSWGYTADDTDPLLGSITLGKVWMGGVDTTVTDFDSESSLSPSSQTISFWVSLDFANATASWGSGSTVPDNDATHENWHVLTLTCDGEVITEIYQPWGNDIRALLNP